MNEAQIFSDEWMEITPKGLRRSPKTIGQHISELKKNIGQVTCLIQTNLRRRTFGMILGGLWLFLEPFLFALLYYFLITVILKFRGGSGGEIRFLFIFTAVIFWRFHVKLLNSSPNLLVSRTGILSQTNFPIQLIVYEFLGTELTFFFFQFIILCLFLMLNGIMPNIMWVFLPFIFIAQFTFSLWFVLIFSSIGIFAKDLSRILFVFVRIWWYLSPGMYSISMIPEKYHFYFNLNPFAHIFPAYRSVFLNGEVPVLKPLGIIFIFSLILVFPGSFLLTRARYYYFKFV